MRKRQWWSELVPACSWAQPLYNHGIFRLSLEIVGGGKVNEQSFLGKTHGRFWCSELWFKDVEHQN